MKNENTHKPGKSSQGNTKDSELTQENPSENPSFKYVLDITNRFKKDFKRCEKRGLNVEILRNAIKLLQIQGYLPEEYRPHKLVNDYAGKWEAHIGGKNSDWIMIWDQNETELILLMLRTGTHSDIF